MCLSKLAGVVLFVPGLARNSNYYPNHREKLRSTVYDGASSFTVWGFIPPVAIVVLESSSPLIPLQSAHLEAMITNTMWAFGFEELPSTKYGDVWEDVCLHFLSLATDFESIRANLSFSKGKPFLLSLRNVTSIGKKSTKPRSILQTSNTLKLLVFLCPVTWLSPSLGFFTYLLGHSICFREVAAWELLWFTDVPYQPC
jgi:hypothetical protein